MFESNKKNLSKFGAIILITGVLVVCYIPQQKDFFTVFPAYSLAFGGYWIVAQNMEMKWKVLLSILIALLPIASFPNLSDDIYRFYWDGRLTLNGISPYRYLPEKLVTLPECPEGLSDIFPKLNSPGYFSVYPPVCQLIYALSAMSKSILATALVMKVVFAGIHCYGLYIVNQWRLNGEPKASALLSWYFLNPLVIVEGIGNLHIELIMVSFLILMYDSFSKARIKSAAWWFATAIATKLLPLILLPFIYFQIPKDKKSIFLGVLFLVLVAYFLPVFVGLDLINLSKSVNLYFQKFEFNASIYYLLRWLGKLISGYNLILYLGPVLGLTTFYLVVKNARSHLSFSLQNHFSNGLYAFGIFLLLSTTVHPWYVVTLVFYAAFCEIKAPIIWSYLIVVTYINYHLESYQEQLWVVALEYVIVGFCLYLEREKWSGIRSGKALNKEGGF